MLQEHFHSYTDSKSISCYSTSHNLFPEISWTWNNTVCGTSYLVHFQKHVLNYTDKLPTWGMTTTTATSSTTSIQLQSLPVALRLGAGLCQVKGGRRPRLSMFLLPQGYLNKILLAFLIHSGYNKNVMCSSQTLIPGCGLPVAHPTMIVSAHQHSPRSVRKDANMYPVLTS
jgi:hypothetical protein